MYEGEMIFSRFMDFSAAAARTATESPQCARNEAHEDLQ
jgi:hypothetical protein